MVFVNLDVGTVIYDTLNADLGISYNAEEIAFGLNTAGLAVGCLLFIPFALKFGRRSVYLVSILVSLASAVWQAEVQTSNDLYGANILSGLAGSISEVICQMTIAGHILPSPARYGQRHLPRNGQHWHLSRPGGSWLRL